MTKINGERWPVRAASDLASVKSLVASMATDPLYRFTVSTIGLGATLCLYLTDFAPAVVVRHDWFRQVVERLETLLDRLLVVVHAPARLGAFQQTLHHHLIRDLEVEHALHAGHLPTVHRLLT